VQGRDGYTLVMFTVSIDRDVTSAGIYGYDLIRLIMMVRADEIAYHLDLGLALGQTET